MLFSLFWKERSISNRFCVNADAGRACPLLIVRSNNACLASSRPGSFNRRRSIAYWHIRRLFGILQAWKLQPAAIDRLLAYKARQAICQSLGAWRWPCRSRDRAGKSSDWHAIPVEFMIFIVTALPSAKVGKVAHELDRRDPFDHFEAQFVLATEPERRSVQHADGRAIHLIGKQVSLWAC
jgi:hypothetical protein